MRVMFALAVAASIVSVAPAMAQSAGYYGAPSGHNTPGSGVGLGVPYNSYNAPSGYNNGYNNGGFGYDNRSAGYGFGYDNMPGRDSYGVPNPSGAIEGRAAVDDDAVVPNRMHRQRPVMDQDDQYMDR
jgi:hypothetical protein